jgi:uncharacterized protein YqgC (DUF456 family)
MEIILMLGAFIGAVPAVFVGTFLSYPVRGTPLRALAEMTVVEVIRQKAPRVAVSGQEPACLRGCAAGGEG